jgi:PEP-CTERM motif
MNVATILTGGGFTFGSAVNGTFVATSGVILTQTSTNLDVFLLGTYTPGTGFGTAGCNVCTATGTLAHVSLNQSGTALSEAITLTSPASSLPGVPEPATMALFGSALVGLGVIGRKRLAR